MATRIYSLNRGQSEFQVVEDVGSATSSTVELTIDLAHGTSRSEFLLMLKMLENHIISKPWPPA